MCFQYSVVSFSLGVLIKVQLPVLVTVDQLQHPVELLGADGDVLQRLHRDNSYGYNVTDATNDTNNTNDKSGPCDTSDANKTNKANIHSKLLPW